MPVPSVLDAAPKEKLLPAGKLKLAGRYVRCGRTPTLISHTFWDYGGAKKGMIILNPSKLEGLSESVRLYVYAHECGHQRYGAKEVKADCYAMQRDKRDGWLTKDGMNEICTFLKPHPGDWVHPPGCGHQFIGRDEGAADCFGIKRGRRYGWLKAEGLAQVCDFISTLKGDADHAAGPKRCENMRRCYLDAAPRAARN